MEQVEKQQREVNVTVDIICDSCGESCKTDLGYEFMSMKANWGYSSKKDMERWEAHICEKCVDTKFHFIKFNKEEIEFQTYMGTASEYEKKLDETISSSEFGEKLGENPVDDSLKK
jgi:hypothetical protein